ncbi:MAG: CD3072 family TudS-related putative desulfidase [Candidatus Heimdallarchaeota archaeon]
MNDVRSGKIVVVSHCILNVHSLEDNLAIYPGLEEEVIQLLVSAEVGIYQLPCPEMNLFGISRKPLPKEAYQGLKVRTHYKSMANKVVKQLKEFIKKGYEIVAVIGAEGSPSCGIHQVGKWLTHIPKNERQFPRDVVFIEGRGVFMEELEKEMGEKDIFPVWVGIPGKSIRSTDPESFQKTLAQLKNQLDPTDRKNIRGR